MTTLPFSIDLSAVKQDLLPLVIESRSLARELRAKWTRPMADAQRTRRRIARRITELLVLVAFVRGRIHVRARPTEWPEGRAWDPDAHALAEATRVAQPYAERVDALPSAAGVSSTDVAVLS